MGFVELLFLAVGLSMDAFAVSVCKGLCMQKAGLKTGVICGSWFGGFQALMPLIGYFLGTLFTAVVSAFDHWIAFGLLAIIGINMLREGFSKAEECCECGQSDLSFKTMFVMAVATSIDAAAAGISIAAKNGNIWIAIALIGVITFFMCCLGVKIGSIFGGKFEKKAQIAGGLILIGLGLKILLEDLGVLPW